MESNLVNVVLVEPEIPPNTGNVIRLCANAGVPLHLVGPLGFELDDKRLRRAGLDYHEWARVTSHDSLAGLRRAVPHERVLAVSTKGTRLYTDVTYKHSDLVLFGPETRGLSQALLDNLPREHCIRIPMRAQSRSLNLANTVALVVYEAWRQQGFNGSLDVERQT